MVYCLIVDEKGNITAARSCVNGTFLSNAVIVSESVYQNVYEGLGANKQYYMHHGDVIERIVCVDRDSAIRRLNMAFDVHVESFVFKGVGENLRLGRVEREQAMLAMYFKIPFPTLQGIILHGSQIESYFKDYNYHYQHLLRLLKEYTARIRESKVDDVDKHVSNFLREVKNAN
jgi:hypothetical protein